MKVKFRDTRVKVSSASEQNIEIDITIETIKFQYTTR